MIIADKAADLFHDVLLNFLQQNIKGLKTVTVLKRFGWQYTKLPVKVILEDDSEAVIEVKVYMNFNTIWEFELPNDVQFEKPVQPTNEDTADDWYKKHLAEILKLEKDAKDKDKESEGFLIPKTLYTDLAPDVFEIVLQKLSDKAGYDLILPTENGVFVKF